MAARNNTGLWVGLGLLTTAVVGGGVAWFVFANDEATTPGGKTGQIPDLTTETDVEQMLAALVCACLDAEIRGDVAISTCVLQRLYAQSDVSWPPPPNATPSHSLAWRTMLSWIQQAQGAANQQNNGDLCAYLRGREAIATGTPAAQPGDVIPSQVPAFGGVDFGGVQLDIEWRPEDEPGFVAGTTFCNDQGDKPYNAAVFADDADNVILEFGLQGHPMIFVDDNGTTLREAAPVIEAYQRSANERLVFRRIGDEPLQIDGVVGGCTLRALGYDRFKRLEQEAAGASA